MGTHPNCPATVAATGETLQAWIEAHPQSLGPAVQRRFGNNLPFLFKVLSVSKALSIQSHPDKALAERLHAEHPKLYPDDNHKPEMALAISDDFEALCSFAPLTHIAAALREVPELAELVGADHVAGLTRAAKEASGQEEAGKQALRGAFSALMTAPQDAVARAVAGLVGRLREAGVAPSAPSPTAPPTTGLVSEVEHVRGAEALALRLDSQYPGGDVGLMAAFFLNTVRLRCGQAIYLPANEPHAYLAGELVECMAASDNVIRAGLTPKFKHADVLCSSLTYETGLPEVLRGDPQPVPGATAATATVSTYRPPFEEFEVRAVRVAGGSEPVALHADQGPQIVLVQAGAGTAHACGGAVMGTPATHHLQAEVALSRGGVFFVPAGTKLSISTQGHGGELLLWVAGANATLFTLHSAVGWCTVGAGAQQPARREEQLAGAV